MWVCSDVVMVLGILWETLMMTLWDVTRIFGEILWYTAWESAGTGCRATAAMVASGHP